MAEPSREIARNGRGLAVSPLGRALRVLGRKQISPAPNPTDWMSVGWRNLRGRPALPRSLKNYLDAYGGTEDSVLWCYACAGKIAEELSGYPWDVLDPEDAVLDPAEVPKELADLLDRPNSMLTYTDWIFWVALDLELAGNSYWLKDRPNALGQPLELLRLRPEFMRRAVNDAGRPIGHVYEINGRHIPFDLSEVVWYRYPDPRDELYGIGTVEAIMRELGADLAIREHVVGFYSQGGRISGVVTVEGGLGEVQFQRLQRQMEEDALVVGSDFRLLIVEQGNNFQPIAETPGESNVVALARMTKDRILTGFKVPEPVLGGVLENANYKIQDSRDVFAQNVRPKATKISERTTIDLVDYWDGKQFRMDVRTNESPMEAAQRTKVAAGTGLSLNQMLDAQGQPTIDDPRADEPLLMSSLVPYSIVMQGGTATAGLAAIGPAGPAEQPIAAEPPEKPTEGGADDEEPLPETAPEEGDIPGVAGAGAVGAGTYGVSPIRAKRPRQRGERRVSAAKSRIDSTGRQFTPKHVHRLSGDDWPTLIDAVYRDVTGRPHALASGTSALPPGPTDQGYPIACPPLPPGFEELTNVIVHKADSGQVVRLLAHRADLIHREYPVWRTKFVDFFISQRSRVVEKLHEFSGSQRGVRRGKKPKSQLGIEAIWDDPAENEGLLAAYNEVLPGIGRETLQQTADMLGSTVEFDLAIPVVADVRSEIASKVVRINKTTREDIRKQIETGLARGYSVPQIASGVAAEDYPGVIGVFDHATAARAETIARTETATVYNLTSLVGYDDAGVEQVEVLDGLNFDEECRNANGQVWTLAEARASPIQHPNCARAFAPIMR